MLYLYASNRLERLADALAETLGAPLPDPLVREIIVVQSRGMARWLALRLAERIGIWAQADFVYPATLIERLAEASGAADRWPDRNGLIWALWEILPRHLSHPAFEAIRRYLDDDADGVKRIQLARRAADVLDKYLAYRPDLLARWERGDIGEDADERWQAELWRALTQRYGPHHRAERLATLRRRLAEGRVDRERLATRLTVFGISALPPAQFDLFVELARRVDIRFYALNPCRELWSDLRSESEQAALLNRAGPDVTPADLHLEVGHPLLAATGRAGRYFFDRMLDAEALEPERPLFEDPGDATLLARLQSDILNLRPPPGPDAPAVPPYRYDNSIRIFSCHSRLREVDVLYDRLLALFETLPGLEPRDVLVMAPDIERYAPAIEAVFDQPGAGRPRLPYAIADRPAGAGNAAARALSLALRLLESRFRFADVMALFDLPPVCRAAGLDENSLDRVRDLLRAANVRWGIDAEHRAALGQPPFAENTWRAAFERLLLNAPPAAAPAADTPAPAAPPADAADAADLEALRRFRDYLEILFAAAADFRRSRSPRRWADDLGAFLERLLGGADAESAEVVRNAVARLRASAAFALGEEPVPLRALRVWLDDQWLGDRPTTPYLARGVTFGNLVPMRSVPFRVVALLGMNDGEFPRREAAAEFDLVARHPRAGDRNRRAEDRYLFLEAVLSARDALMIFYVGQSIRDNSEKPPSVVVRELLETLGGRAAAERLLVRQPLQPFSHRYFAGDPELFTYSEEAAVAVAGAPGALVRVAGGAPPLPAPDDLRMPDLDTLAEFYRHPARFWVRRRLNAAIDERPPPPDDVEPMELDSLDAHILRERIAASLEATGKAPTAAEIEKELRAEGLLPYGTLGELAVQNTLREVSAYFARLQAERGIAPPRALEIDLQVAGRQLRGRLDNLHGRTLVHGRPGSVRAGDRLAAWVRHLAANAAEPGLATVFIGKDESLRFTPMNADAARARLDALLRWYDEGLSRPLPLYPEASLAYAEAWAKDNDAAKARAVAYKAWASEFADHPGEYHRDVWLQLLIPETERDAALNAEFEKLAVDVLGPLIAAAQE